MLEPSDGRGGYAPAEMTAEVAVMNKQGVALAADSAVTISGAAGSKILASANKIFALSKYRPVGVMIYGTAGLLGVPWETIIKTYRQEIGDLELDSIDDYTAHFLDYLQDNQHLFPTEVQKPYVFQAVAPVYEVIAIEVRATVRDSLRADKDVAHEEVVEIAAEVIGRLHRIWKTLPPMPFQDDDLGERILSDYRPALREAQRSVFERLALDEETAETLAHLGVLILTRIPPPDVLSTTGVVIAGFGAKDLYPSFNELLVDGLVADQLVAWPDRNHAIGPGAGAYLGAFAQGEMVNRFMEGIDPEYDDTMHESFGAILSGYTTEVLRALGRHPPKKALEKVEAARRELLDEYRAALDDHRHDTFVAGILRVVASQPLDQLADVAESLVSLTSFKRRVSMESETVSGPVDVAVISRGDGFIWIKRKHYFEPELNPQFFANYYRGGSGTN